MKKKRTRRKTTLHARLGELATPVFLVSDRRHVLFFNAGCERLTGWAADEVVGRVCDYAGEPDPARVESLTGSLCPPPEAFAGIPQSVPAYLVHRDGRPLGRLLHFFPLTAEDGGLDSILGIITPIAEPRQAAAGTPAQQLHAELTALRVALWQRYRLTNLVCRSEAMSRVLAQIHLARGTRSPFVLRGEAGSGKEHVARVIHYESESRGRAFVPLDCRRTSAIDMKLTLRRLLEGDGDGDPAPGLRPGTVYLADVEHLPRDLQQYLVDQWDREEPRSGLRFIAGTTADLDRAVETDLFRRDFFYRLTPLWIELPPLRRRPEDLAPLAQAFLEALNRGAERQVGGFADPVLRLFREYNWPGNLDELAAVIEEARAAAGGPVVEGRDLPFRFRTGMEAQSVGPVVQPRAVPLAPLLEQVEREQIELALAQARHNKSRAADLLGIPRPRLYRRMQALGITDLEGEP